MKIAVLLPYFNPHIYPVFLELGKIPGVEVRIAVFAQVDTFRANYGWEDSKDIYRLYKQEEKQIFDDFLTSCDHCFCHGFFYRRMLGYIIFQIPKHLNIYVLSESQHVLRQSNFRDLLKRMILPYFNRTRFFLLTLGGRITYEQYKRWGASKWNGVRFGYSVYPLKRSTRALEDAGKSFNILFVGQLVPRKNLQVMLNAIKKLVLEKQTVIFTIAGDGPLKQQLELYVAENMLRSHVVFKGFVRWDELSYLYEQADVFILPSLFEGWGAVLNEAMSFGLPVITSEGVMSNEELIWEGENGFVFRNAEHLVDILRKLIEMPKSRRQIMKKKSLEIIDLWHPEHLAARLYEFLTDIEKQQIRGFDQYQPMEIFSVKNKR